MFCCDLYVWGQGNHSFDAHFMRELNVASKDSDQPFDKKCPKVQWAAFQANEKGLIYILDLKYFDYPHSQDIYVLHFEILLIKLNYVNCTY